VKRLFDFLAAAIGLLVFSPILIGIAVVVRVTSPGPVLFRQERIGQGGVPFQILKFRSMRVANQGSQITVAGDHRITAAGAVLRKTKLDELPQLINVLVGEMSLVGPRPEVPKYVAMYPPDVRQVVLSVRPGITDNAAIEFRNESEILARAADPEAEYIQHLLPRKLELYQQYVRNQSFLGDVRIVLCTLTAIVRR
jgi:lipopolysaccharide/colanic/teichoic acid biosynthesis glycosyltransferase